MKKRVLMIDDTRDESNVSMRIDLIARTYWTGVGALEKFEKWDLLLLDHDLNSFDTETGREYTGYDIVCFLESNPHLLPKETKIISSNPVGRQRMQMVLDKLYARKT